jgi:molybdenum cofactor synthesis domain-containing protein
VSTGTAAILTIGNELVSGDVVDTNARFIARRLAGLGVEVRLVASLPDEIDAIVAFVRREAPVVDHLLVTGGLGGTPDDLTREAVAAAFGVEQDEVPELAQDLRARFARHPEYAARWARLPAGSRPIRNPLGGAPGFAIENVYVFPGLPSEMEAMLGEVEDELRRETPIASWRRTYATGEAQIVAVLEQMGELHPQVTVGSYPSFAATGPETEVVVKSSDRYALDAAASWLERALRDALA